MNVGFFGGLDFDCLNVDLHKEVKTIRIELNSHSREILNLRRVKVFDDKSKAINLSDVANCYQSSCYKNNAKYGGVNVLNEMPIHTEKELRPYIEITFKKLQKISSIYIYNRMDKWGGRSRTLRVVYCIDNDEWEVAHDFTSRKWSEMYSDYTNEISNNGGENGIANSIFNSNGGFCSWNWLLLMQSVSNDPLINVHDARYTIFAALILSAYIKNKNVDIIQLIISSRISLLLDDVDKIDVLVDKINEISVSIGLERMMLSRHGLMPTDRLNLKADIYIFHLSKVMSILKEVGYESVLSYGTLLGAIREGRFLSHDDDVDILYLSHAVNINDVLHERKHLFEMFSAFGYTVSAGEKNMNFHVKSKADGVLIDVFPSWVDGECINLHMAKMNIEKLIAKKVFPSTSTALIHGVEFPIPEDSRYFLEERYGPFYFSSEKYFEWRWPVKKNKKMKVGLTYGTFDLLHHGHVRLLERIKARCDILIVGVSSDGFNYLKNKKSYQGEKVRMKMVSSLLCVDHVFSEESWDQKINDVHRFSVTDFFMGDDWFGKFDFLSEIVNVHYLERTPDISSSKIKCELKMS